MTTRLLEGCARNAFSNRAEVEPAVRNMKRTDFDKGFWREWRAAEGDEEAALVWGWVERKA
jgi:hypothetical protein